MMGLNARLVMGIARDRVPDDEKVLRLIQLANAHRNKTRLETIAVSKGSRSKQIPVWDDETNKFDDERLDDPRALVSIRLVQSSGAVTV